MAVKDTPFYLQLHLQLSLHLQPSLIISLLIFNLVNNHFPVHLIYIPPTYISNSSVFVLCSTSSLTRLLDVSPSLYLQTNTCTINCKCIHAQDIYKNMVAGFEVAGSWEWGWGQRKAECMYNSVLYTPPHCPVGLQ